MIHAHRFAFALLALVPLASPRLAAAKDKPAPAAGGPAKTGLFQLDAKPSYPYVAMAVPADYTPTKAYPLFYLMPPISNDAKDSLPDKWVALWAGPLLKKGWIVASPAAPFYDNETSIAPIQATLKKVIETYKIDERRVVIAGDYAGANMAWRLAVKLPTLWVGLVAEGGEVAQVDRAPLKAFAGKPVYVYRGEKDKNYNADVWKADKAAIEFAKLKLTIEIGPGAGNEFPLGSLDKIATWLDDVWSPGAYREKAAVVEKALAAKDVAAGFAALKEFRDELKRSPYPAYELRIAEFEKALLDLARAPFESAKKLLDVDPIAALGEVEAAAKAVKGIAAIEKEAVAALAAMRKDPRVVEAIKKRDAEASARKLLPAAEAAEAKGDFAAALALFKKIVALGETSLKADCEAKVAELEKKVGK
jgi:dienelactone hydrolase